MKQIISLMLLMLSFQAAANGIIREAEEEQSYGEREIIRNADEKEESTEIQKEEDKEFQLKDGTELEYDPDVLGDDEIEIND